MPALHSFLLPLYLESCLRNAHVRRYWEGNDALRGATVAANASGRDDSLATAAAAPNVGGAGDSADAAGGVVEDHAEAGDGALDADDQLLREQALFMQSRGGDGGPKPTRIARTFKHRCAVQPPSPHACQTLESAPNKKNGARAMALLRWRCA